MNQKPQRIQIMVRTPDPRPLAEALLAITSGYDCHAEFEIGVAEVSGEFGLGLGITVRDRPVDEIVTDLPEVGEALTATGALVVAGPVHDLIAGPAVTLRVTFPVVRSDSFTTASFSDYWLCEHVKIPRSIPGFHSYSQLHADPALTQNVADCWGLTVAEWDGCALVGHVDFDEYERVMRDPIFTGRAVPDMATFVDQQRSSFNLFRIVTL